MQYGFAADGVRAWLVTANVDETTHSGSPSVDCGGRLASPPAGFQYYPPPRAQGTFQPEFAEAFLEPASGQSMLSGNGCALIRIRRLHMEKKRLFLTIVAVCLVVFGVTLFTLTQKQNATAFVGVPDTADSKAIQATIIRSYKIEAEAAATFNTSAFDSVFVNDVRGGELIQPQLKFMQDIANNPSKTDFGYLDYKIAYYVWWEKGAAAQEELQAKVAKEGRNPTKEEMQSLIDSTGRMAPPRSILTETPEIEFMSIAIDGDRAIAIFDDGPRTNEMTLVRIGGRWLIAGNKILVLHP